MPYNYQKKRRLLKIESLQKQVDKIPKENYDCVVRVPVDFIETKLQGFIEFLNKDKKRFLNLEKAKYDYINFLIKRSKKKMDTKVNKHIIKKWLTNNGYRPRDCSHFIAVDNKSKEVLNTLLEKLKKQFPNNSYYLNDNTDDLFVVIE